MHSLRTVLIVLLCVGASCGCTANNARPLTVDAHALEQKEKQREPDVPYVPTPHEVVAEMLKLANVTKNDVVYDLGSGDGRIVITAAQKFGARGVGVDINPTLVKQARDNAEKAGVSDRVKFLEQDLFETDIREATVVTLYLFPEVNIKLRPKLLKELKPGTRVVSHAFDMNEWEPDKTVEINCSRIYYWVIPKNGQMKLRQ